MDYPRNGRLSYLLTSFLFRLKLKVPEPKRSAPSAPKKPCFGTEIWFLKIWFGCKSNLTMSVQVGSATIQPSALFRDFGLHLDSELSMTHLVRYIRLMACRPSVCLSVVRLSSDVRLSSVTFVHRTQIVELFSNIFAPRNSLGTWTACINFFGEKSHGCTVSCKLNGRGYEQLAFFD